MVDGRLSEEKGFGFYAYPFNLILIINNDKENNKKEDYKYNKHNKDKNNLDKNKDKF